MNQDEWERTRKALETELIEKAFDLSDHMGRLHGFSLEIANTSPPLYLRLGETDKIGHEDQDPAEGNAPQQG